MNEREAAKAMLDLAAEDLDALQRMLSDPGFSERVFGFHAQQATEKALKALLTLHSVEYPKTHDLRSLAGLLADHAIDLPEEVDAVLGLTAYGVRFRYDSSADFYEPLDRPKVASLAKEVIVFVERQVVR